MLYEYLGLVVAQRVERKAVLILGTAFAILIAINGVLFTFQPKLFLKFYDWQNPGDDRGKVAGWRKDVYNSEYKFLGIVLLLSGLLFLGMMAKVLMKA